MIRHLSAFHYDTREQQEEMGVVTWRQWKRTSARQTHGEITDRRSSHQDPEPPRMIYTKRGRRIKKEGMKPRFAKPLRTRLVAAAEKLRKQAAEIAHREIVRIGYAPGSPAVDVWWLEHKVLVHAALSDAKLHRAAHKLAEHIAAKFSDPDQPLSVWDRAKE